MASDRGNQALPTKDQSAFRQVVKYYESKQYKKGLKAADQILKKHPNHGETMAMKGLILNYVDRKKEAYDLVRDALKHDLRSHICWHVYGVLYRSDREYKEAVKCYSQALRLDPQNMQILRDLAHMQVQIRDIAGMVETRQRMLTAKPNQRNHWIGFAVAHHLDQNYEVAVQVLDAYEGTLDELPSSGSEVYEHSEMLLYKAMILQEAGLYQRALDHLSDSAAKIKDKLGLKEMQAALLLQTEQTEDACNLYRALLKLIPDNHQYHRGLQQAMTLAASGDGRVRSAEQVQALQTLYQELAGELQHASSVFRLPLDFLSGAEFERAADLYVRRFLLKGIPSLFADLKPLNSNPSKASALLQLFQRLLAHVEEHGRLPALEGRPDTDVEAPEAAVWILMYLAQHHDLHKDTGTALECIDRALQKQPDLIELYSVKSKVLKHAGDPKGAMLLADTARKMDLADRYLNCVAVRRMFRAGYREAAEATAALFTRDGDQLNNLFDMQCMWYEIEYGMSHLAVQDYGRALKKLHAVLQHFADFTDDQFDFHSYCFRKMTLRAYVRMLRMEDGLLSHSSFRKGALGVVRSYLELSDARCRGSGNHMTEEDEKAMLEAMSPEERRRYKVLKKKEESRRRKELELREKERLERQKAAQEAASSQQPSHGQSRKKSNSQKDKDDDPDGAKLAAVEDPLGEALKLLEKLQQYHEASMPVQELAFQVYRRKGHMLLALRAVRRALALTGGASQPGAHRLVVQFCHEVEKRRASGEASSQPVVAQLIEEEVASLLQAHTSLASYNAAFLQDHGHRSLEHICAAAEMAALIGSEAGIQEAAGRILAWNSAADSERDHDGHVAAHRLLEHTLKLPDAAAQWREQSAKVFRWSAFFNDSDSPGLQQQRRVNGATDGIAALQLSQ